jgi:hypothetical protein
MTPAGFELPLPAARQPQMYVLDRATTGIGDCGVKSFKVTIWEWRFNNEMDIVIGQEEGCVCAH